MTAPDVCFFKDFDSFTLESDYLKIVYGSTPFRFLYSTNHEDRKFFIKSLGKIEITLPEVWLQYEDRAGFDTAYLVNLCAEFEDALKFGSFVEQLTRVAGYRQVQLPEGELSTSSTFDSENDDDMNESDIRENTLDQHHFVEAQTEKMSLPLVKFTERQPLQYRFAQRFFEVYHPESRKWWRFLHAPNRQYGSLHSSSGRQRYLIQNTTFQAKKRGGRAQYVPVGRCDVEFDVANRTRSNLTCHLDDIAHGYTAY